MVPPSFSTPTKRTVRHSFDKFSAKFAKANFHEHNLQTRSRTKIPACREQSQLFSLYTNRANETLRLSQIHLFDANRQQRDIMHLKASTWRHVYG